MSRYAGGSFALGDGFFPEVKALWKRAPRNFWGSPTLYPFPVSCIRVNESRTSHSKCPERAGIFDAVK